MIKYSLAEIEEEIEHVTKFIQRPRTQQRGILSNLIGDLGELMAYKLYGGELFPAREKGVDIRVNNKEYQIKSYMENSSGTNIKLHPTTYSRADGVYFFKFTSLGKLLGVAFISREQLKMMVYEDENGNIKYDRVSKNSLIFKEV
jgi:hypothetical protein